MSLVDVDGSHWSGHKRLGKPDRSGKGGHVGFQPLQAISPLPY
jgi:hypothetical protein